MRELNPAQIHLWNYAIGEPPAGQHLVYGMTLLSDAEKHRCAAFRLEKHRTEYVLSHAVLRLVLSEYAPVRPEAWKFSTGKWGRPEICGPALDTPLWFNLSHTDGFVACVVGRVPQLGVDVENMNRVTSWDELAKRFFAEVEYQYLRNMPPGLQREAFFRIWTLKESYIKAEGKGLSIPLDSFHFHFSDKVTLELNGEFTPDGWSFFEFLHGSDYRISIGANNGGLGRFQVQNHDAVSLFNQWVL